jgi:hypothetical protein
VLGAWRSLVARVLWEHEVPGSNPGAPISGSEWSNPAMLCDGGVGGGP